MPEPPPRAGRARVQVEGHEQTTLSEGWEAARCAPDEHLEPGSLTALQWLAARIPGTAAAVLRDAGAWRAGRAHDFDAEDWWFRVRFECAAAARDELALELDGIATLAEVFLNGELVLVSESMFASHRLEVSSQLAGENELAIRCRALAPVLAQRRKPRARWRTRLVDGNLRFHRTMLLGRAPGFAPGPAAVGPWRPVRLVRRRTLAVDALTLTTSIDARTHRDGVLAVDASLRTLDGGTLEAVEVELDGPSGVHRAALELSRAGGRYGAAGTLRIPAVERWWPHTHGTPALHQVRVLARVSGTCVTVDAGRVGFRELAAAAGAEHDLERDGLDLHVNGVRTFARGAVWTPPDFVGLAPTREQLRAALERVRAAGMNMLRVPGTALYESSDFHDLCDDLGVLLWQDFMFANLDYPIADEGFRAAAEQEARALLGELGGRPSVAVLCGNSEVEQQVAMLGLDPALGRGELFGELLPQLVADAGTGAVYVPSAPCGGALPFRPDRGVANYYGVGGYRRPLEDARRAEVRFAAECLAFSNVPDEQGVQALAQDGAGEPLVHDPRWKVGVPRDVGVGWDFEDVRDHYLGLLFGVEPRELRSVDHDRYLELSRAVSGECMTEVFGEWRRSASPCGGGLVLWLRDLQPGAGWGVLDHAGRPKPAYHHLRRALAPVCVWMTDEGLGGIRLHVANDRDEPLEVRLRVALYRDGERRVAEAEEPLALPPHGACERDFEALLGYFTDVSYAYRFGPPGHDTVVASLERDAAHGRETLSQAFRFPTGRPLRQLPAATLGLAANVLARDEQGFALELLSRCVAYGVRIHAPGFAAADDALTLEPGVARTIALAREPDEGDGEGTPSPTGWLSALNLRGTVDFGGAEGRG